MDDKSSPPSSIDITNQQLSQSQLTVEKSIPPPSKKSNKHRNPLQQVMAKVQNLCQQDEREQMLAQDKDMDDTTTKTYETQHHRGSTNQKEPTPLKNKKYASQSQLDEEEDGASNRNLLMIPNFSNSAGSVKSGNKSGVNNMTVDETEAYDSYNSTNYKAGFGMKGDSAELDGSDTSRTTLGNSKSQYLQEDDDTTNTPTSKQNTSAFVQEQPSQNPIGGVVPRDNVLQQNEIIEQQPKQQEPSPQQPFEQQPSEQLQKPTEHQPSPEHQEPSEQQPPELQEPSPEQQESPQPTNNETPHTTTVSSVSYVGVPAIIEILHRECMSGNGSISFYTRDGKSGFEIKSCGDKVTKEEKEAFMKWLANEVYELYGRTFSPASIPALLNGVGLKALVPKGWSGLRPFYTREDMLFVKNKPELMRQIIDKYKDPLDPLKRKHTVQGPGEDTSNKRHRLSQGNAAGESVKSGADVTTVAEKQVPPETVVESSGAKSAPVADWQLVVGNDKNNPDALKLAYKQSDGSLSVEVPPGVPTLYFDLRATSKSWTVILANLPGAFLDEPSVLAEPSLYHLRAAIQKDWATMPSYTFRTSGRLASGHLANGRLINSKHEKSVTVHKYQKALINEDAEAHNQADGTFENPFIVYITYD